jgi:hypothetical protein
MPAILRISLTWVKFEKEAHRAPIAEKGDFNLPFFFFLILILTLPSFRLVHRLQGTYIYSNLPFKDNDCSTTSCLSYRTTGKSKTVSETELNIIIFT